MWSTVDAVLSPEVCRTYIERFESGRPEVAPIIRANRMPGWVTAPA